MNLWPDDSEDEYVPGPSGSEPEDSEEESPVILKPPQPSSSHVTRHEPSPASRNEEEGGGEEENEGQQEGEEDKQGLHNEEAARPRRKRRRRSAGLDMPEGRLPYKRMPGVFNADYLGLLNEDIDDAKEKITADPKPSKFFTSQIGMVVWTATEKQLFFDAVGKLGKGDLRGIASRIQTKSIPEVTQYMQLLEKEATSRVAQNRDIVTKADIPAAAEISLQCCLALDAAADELSLRQQRYEEKREQQKWAEFPWVITQTTASELDQNPKDYDEPFVQLFHLPTWLKLSGTVFMNASFPENNWHFIDEEPPAIRSTAFQDFHNLTVSITRRIISSAIFFSSSRIRAKGPTETRLRDLVKRGDVVAAVKSLGLARDSGKFWAKCPRRLKLDVYDDKGLREGADGESDAEDGAKGLSVLSFAEVEHALGLTEELQEDSSEESQSEDDDNPEDETPPTKEENDIASDDDEVVEAQLQAAEATMDEEIRKEIEDEEAQTEARELIFHTALDIPPTRRTIDAIKRRVMTERNHESYAASCDEVASVNGELKLWEMLKLDPPESLARKNRVLEQARREAVSTDDYLKREDWRKSIKYVSEWEVTTKK